MSMLIVGDKKETYEWHGVLAGAYRGNTPKRLLAHLIDWDRQVVLCGLVPAEHLADPIQNGPYCPTCLRKFNKK